MNSAEKVQRPVLALLRNNSGLHPKGHAILTLPIEGYKGVLALPDSVKEKFLALENTLIVLELGAACWNDEPEPRAKVGDRVLVTKFAGHLAVGQDGRPYRIINDRDIFCVTEVKDNG